MSAVAQPDHIASLWSAARAMFERLCAAVGEAASLALRRTLPPAELTRMRALLRPLELLVRQIVFVEAAALARASGAGAPRVIVLPKPLFNAPTPPRPPRERAPSFRLWPRAKETPARIRPLGPPTSVREIYRERARRLLADRLTIARFMRRPEPARIARRIEALARILATPLRAVRRLARMLKLTPHLARRLATLRRPRAGYADEDALGLAARLAFAAGRALDTS